ncbi:MAG: YdcF family protein [Halanaerobium sp.]
MLALEKIVAAFVMPPGLFILIIFILTLYLFLKTKSKLIKLTALLTLIVLIFMSTAFGVNLLLHPLENYADDVLNKVEAKHPIVVLGGGIYYKDEANVQLSVHSLQRTVKGYQLYNEFKTPIVYTGGIAVGHDGISEADAAEEFLLSLGVDVDDYIREGKAQSTYENGKYIKQWMHDNDIEKIYLVTSAYHIFRSAAVFRAQDIEFIPVHSGFIYDHKLGWLDYLPSRGALAANMSALHEWVGIIWYYLNGRI